MAQKYCIVNFENEKIISVLKSYGYICIPTIKSNNVSEPIACHADVLYLKTNNNVLYVSKCQYNNYQLLQKIGYKINNIELNVGYKTESKLNMVITNNLIMCNPKTCTDIDNFKSNKQIIYVKQGYTKCSTIIINDNCFITEDESIYKSLINSNYKCLLIDKAYVRLDGYEYGFIGGASAVLNKELLLFFGDISKHPQYNLIKEFCVNNNINIDYIEDMQLTDIGGIVEL